MAPLAKALQADPRFQVNICLTAQHREMLDQVMAIFELRAEYDLDVMTPQQTLPGLTADVMQGLSRVFAQAKPDLVLVHGDTTTSFVASLAAFYQKIPVGHVEAGLRTGDMMAPWPEEANRRLTGVLAEWHFAPTETARQNLLNENIPATRIWVTGNTVIDALLMVRERITQSPDLSQQLRDRLGLIDDQRRMILVTGHRRENIGEPFRQVMLALKQIAEQHEDVQIVFPVHLNPAVREPVDEILGGIENINLVKPQDYLTFVYLLMQADLVITDSGGVQEEAPSLGKPVLVTRALTERPEALEAGTVKLVGTEGGAIVDAANVLLSDDAAYRAMSRAMNPYGDGKACARIIKCLETLA